MAKLPAFQFYPADWLNDIKLQSCSLEARGLLIDLMCVMHQSEKYGYLLINGSIPSNKEVAHLLRLHHKTYDKRLKELILKGVLCVDENGLILNKRMVKDEYIRQVRREAGKLGGNPLLKQEDKQDVKQKTTPSSSSSFSSSFSFKEPTKEEISEASLPKIKEDTKAITKKLYEEKIFPKVIAFVNTMNKEKKNPRAILHTLSRCYLVKPKDPWAYCVKIIKQESGSYHAREYEKSHPKDA